MFPFFNLRYVTVLLGLLTLLGAIFPASAQLPATRIKRALADAERLGITGSKSPLATSSADVGDLNASTPLGGMNLVFARSSDQENDLQELLAAQQSRTSRLYHAWLTPEQFGARFGMSDADLATATSWLESQGFSVQGVNRSRNRIIFTGNASQAQSAFGVALHNFRSGSVIHFAPAGDVTLPAPLAAVTQAVTGLSSFRPHSHLRRQGVAWVSNHFTSGQSSSHYLTPGDIKTIYDISPAYTAGYNGSGQSIAIVGQSAVVLSDIEKFQSAAGLTIKDPTLVLVPNSGTSTVYTDDESESDLDLEYSGAIATGATIKFVYVGSNQNYSVTDAEAYAIDNDLAPIISASYGECETALGSADYATQNALLKQAAAQGQTFIAASGDDGSSDCAEAKLSGLAVDFPASSQYVTAIGGTEFATAEVAASNTTYWQATSSSDVIASALSYIPEQAWNDSTTSELSSGGGGVSALTARPSWQTGVTGISSGSYRLVPDLSLAASPENAGYLYCSSDSDTGITGSCSNGFRDTNDVYLTVAGGTSFGAPIFAGMLALINQAEGTTSGQGIVNATLYTLAASSATYASVFHDVTSGTNECPSGYLYCSSAGETSYAAEAGYDEATGLGSIDLYNLLMAWTSTTTASNTLLNSSTTLSAKTMTPASGDSDVIAITVASGSSTSATAPTGSVSITVDGTSATFIALAAGTASYTFSSTTAGTHIITATYSGDSIYNASAGTITLTIPSSSTASSSFTLAATNVTVTAGSSAASTVTVTPIDGYTGTIIWSLASTSTLANACYQIDDTTVSGTSSVTAALTIYTSASDCTSETPLSNHRGRHAFTKRSVQAADLKGTSQDLNGGQGISATLTMAALCLLGIGGMRTKRLQALAVLLLAITAGFVVVGCGSGSSTLAAASSDATASTSTLTLTGSDSASSLVASTTLTLTVN